ncbi:hypothetical protein A6046_01290 [[Haemophilus] ducreyi]|uniref:Uncharacterized protein n=1 Tax=Haemophilus ducreyi TaxID=730 RepID=A0AAC8UCB2_HAEDC|nr:hypothetical protein RY60_03410 [[Haemophilus] ducreyi]AKO32250.1 hypothetical protein RZ57_03420 [[Haemophilus] ducreyi]AKO33704.1 hypothetical protein RZ58_03430 [[Haemophilus] ducreyi]AKO35151.1 hypothetical protein RZ59_03400 [[Haemophilus] ducreyi]AKO39594.1 hypothetical protein RZ63_03460 [[Haemophilus] ducreyi]
MESNTITLNKKNVRNHFIFLNSLPYTPETNKSLALLIFVAILWLTEPVHIAITALLSPILAIFLDLVKSKAALVTFADPPFFLFFGGFALATALHIQQTGIIKAGFLLNILCVLLIATVGHCLLQ